MNELAIWTEKYRPKNFDEIVGQEEIVKRVEALVKARNLPHMLFAGHAGCGKTTLALVIAKQLFGSRWKENFLELNASDERGIDVIRLKVKLFARTKAFGEVPFKIILLDESDALTKDAQHALRRIMEMYTQTCRFILSCNQSAKIIEPIQSRCAVFRFNLLDKKAVAKVIEKIAKAEHFKITDQAIDAICAWAKGDLRKVINVLQASASLKKQIDKETIESVISKITPSVRPMLELALTGNFFGAREKLYELLGSLNGLDLVKAIQKELWALKINQEKKLKLVEKCAETEFRLTEGCDELIQLEALLAAFAQ